MDNNNPNSKSFDFENLGDDQALEFWKYFAGIGGIDKDRMVTITTWLLAFSASIIGYTLTHFNQSSTPFLALIGMFISLFACWIVLLYGSYAMWNWAMADRIAKIKDWKFLLPDRSSPIEKPDDLCCLKKFEYLLIEKLGKPPFPRSRYAIIFRRFFLISLGSALINIVILYFWISKVTLICIMGKAIL